MTRLFIRFYLGVVVVLIAAWLIQSWLSGERLAAQNAQVVRDALFGGIRNARDKYRFGLIKGLEKEFLADIKNQFDYPVRLHNVTPEWEFDVHLIRGEDIQVGDGTFIMARVISGREPVLLFGPLPRLAEPSQWEVLTGLGAVFLLAAVAIALLLRPVVKQFQLVEDAASKIASGDLSARIEEGRGLKSSKLVLAFNDMAGQTEAMVKTQREMLQAVSHELRTPLSRIHFAVDLIQSSDDTARQEHLNSLTSAADDLNDLVGELLSYVRLENRNDVRSNVAVADRILTLIEKHAPLFPNIRFEADESLTTGTSCVAVELAGFDRAITNLLANAGRFAQEKVQVCMEVANDMVLIHIDDDGPGIPEEDRTRVLDPFVRISDSVSGVGLGLSIVRRIVEQHGGFVRISDSPLSGCRVTTAWSGDSGD